MCVVLKTDQEILNIIEDIKDLQAIMSIEVLKKNSFINNIGELPYTLVYKKERKSIKEIEELLNKSEKEINSFNLTVWLYKINKAIEETPKILSRVHEEIVTIRYIWINR
jgi:hypothetical protein